MIFTQDISEKYEADICIVGGGPAGCAAAIAAARMGAKVILTEQTQTLGGMGTNGMVSLFMTFKGDNREFCADGIGHEIYDRLHAHGNVGDHEYCFNPEQLKRIYDDMLNECGASVIFGATCVGVMKKRISKDREAITHGVFYSVSGLYAIKAKVFIDASGDANLGFLANAEFSIGDEAGEVMPATLCSAWGSIDFQQFYQSGVNPFMLMPDALAEGKFFKENQSRNTIITQNGPRSGCTNMGHVFAVDPVDEQSVSKAVMKGRRQIPEFISFYKHRVPGFQDVELIATAPALGIRESRRLHCEYELNYDDYVRRSIFEDEIGRFAYGIDIHSSSADIRRQNESLTRFKSCSYGPQDSYGIPYRSLIVRHFSNLLCAGRCIGVDRLMQGSIRVMPGCYLTGQGAGVAAALARGLRDVRDVRAGDLQEHLLRLGAYLPHCRATENRID